jgi:lipoprotein-anchoring transpeptidase ErfK/SrfK
MKKSAQARIYVFVKRQQLTLKVAKKKVREYLISTSRFGLGSEEGSMKTPTGRFRVAEKIGSGMPLGTVFKRREPVKMTKKLLLEADLIMTRILWLDGLDPGNANTHQRFIYIHGTNHEESIGKPASHGCIRMKKADVAELFELVGVDTPVVIKE